MTGEVSGMSKSISIIDTTLRDGQQSLWAMNMRTGVMLTALEHLDRAGFEAMEFYVPVVQIKKMIRDLGEDPFQWLRLGAKKAKHTPLRLHAGYRSGLGKIPESVAKLLVQVVIDSGISVARISDPWNDFDHLKEEHDGLRAMGMESVINLIYSVSPRHTDDYFIDRVKKAAALNPYRLCFKDVGGLLTPDRIDTILPRIKEAAGGIPIEFHCHCNNGLAPFNVVKVLQHGLTHIHTAVPPLANASSQPSVFNVAANIRALGFDPGLDEAPLKQAETFLTGVAEREGLAIGQPFEYDASLYRHQVPGGMISNLRYQLIKVKQEHRLPEVLEEVVQVRADFGFPIMVTPLSQFVGTQAAVNVMVGERYRQVTDETIQYALGQWGKEALQHMDPEVRDRILDRPRARELAAVEFPQPSLADVRRHYGERLSDEELLLRVYVGEDAIKIARNAPNPSEDTLSGTSLVALIRSLTRVSDKSHVSFAKSDLRVTLSRREG
jgi:oxaloacetate decarboxylase (Na+ extruding) subunit alpha